MSHFWLCLFLFAGHTLALSETYSSRTDDDAYLSKFDAPDPGPEMPDTVYIPGTPGAPWSKEEIDSTRLTILFYLIVLVYPKVGLCRVGNCLSNKPPEPLTIESGRVE